MRQIHPPNDAQLPQTGVFAQTGHCWHRWWKPRCRARCEICFGDHRSKDCGRIDPSGSGARSAGATRRTRHRGDGSSTSHRGRRPGPDHPRTRVRGRSAGGPGDSLPNRGEFPTARRGSWRRDSRMRRHPFPRPTGGCLPARWSLIRSGPEQADQVNTMRPAAIVSAGRDHHAVLTSVPSSARSLRLGVDSKRTR